MSNENTRINAVMRAAYRSRRITVDNSGRIVRGPVDEDAETEPTEDAEPKRPGRADGGARGAIPVDPVASINDAIRTSARRGRGA